MKILHLIYDDPDNPWLGGGGAIRTLKINRVIALNHSITVITGNFPGAKNCVKDGISYQRIGSNKSYFLSRLTFAKNARQAVRNTEHDLLVEDFSGNSPTFASYATNKPSIAVLQNFFGINILRKKMAAGVIPWIYEKLCIRQFDRFIPVNRSIMKKFIPEIKECDYRVIPQGIDRSDLATAMSPAEFFLFVGRLDFYQKGIDILIRSLSMVAELNIPLVMVGGGDSHKLTAMAKKSKVDHLLKYHPRLPHDQILEMYRKSYCLLLPSRYEGWPLVCLESYSQGKPVIGTAIPGFENVLQNDTTGIKIPVADPIALADAMRKMATDSALRNRLGNNALTFAADYIWENLALQQEQFYKETIEG